MNRQLIIKSLDVIVNPAPARVARANWWFQHMREVVDKAIDWKPNYDRQHI